MVAQPLQQGNPRQIGVAAEGVEEVRIRGSVGVPGRGVAARQVDIA